jgi:excinuclease ABC subunit B
MSKEQLQKAMASAKREMEKAAADLDFIRAAKFRDEMKYLGELISKK